MTNDSSEFILFAFDATGFFFLFVVVCLFPIVCPSMTLRRYALTLHQIKIALLVWLIRFSFALPIPMSSKKEKPYAIWSLFNFGHPWNMINMCNNNNIEQ